MTKKIRKILIVFVFAANMLLICGCHGKKMESQCDFIDGFDENKKYEITFWAKNDTNKAQTDIYKKAIDDFHDIYPNITVTIRLYTDYGRIYNDVITNINTSTTPNVCITYPDHIATYVSGQELVVDLNDVMKDEKYGFGGSEIKFDSPEFSQIIPKFLDEGVIDGNQYAIPYMRSTEACYVNKTMVEALGFEMPSELTWDFVWEVSEAATKKDENGNFVINGQKVLIPFIYKSTDNMMIQYLAQAKEPLSDSLGNVMLFNDTTKDFLYDIARYTGLGTFSTFKVSSYPANFLNAGQCIFAIDSTAGATWMGAKAPLSDISDDVKVDFETVVYKIPQLDVENPKMISQGPSICIFNKEDPGEVMASWLFAQYLLTNEVQISYSQTEGYIPVTSKALESEEYKDYLSRRGEDNNKYYAVKLDAVKLLIDNIDNTFVTSVFNGSASVRDAAGALIESVVKTVRRKGTVDEEYLEKLFSDTSSLYHLDQIEIKDKQGQQIKELGKLPTESIVLIFVLVFIWVSMVIYIGFRTLKKGFNHIH